MKNPFKFLIRRKSEKPEIDPAKRYLRLDRSGHDNLVDIGVPEYKAIAKSTVYVTKNGITGLFAVNAVCPGEHVEVQYSIVNGDVSTIYYAMENELTDIDGLFQINVERITRNRVTIGFIADESVKFVRADVKRPDDA